jgi:hypothetical protein
LGGGGGRSSSSTVSINYIYQFLQAFSTLNGAQIPKQFMGWEFNGLPGGNGGSGYIGGKGGNGGAGVSGMPNTTLSPTPVLQRSILYGQGDTQKIAEKLLDLFGGGGGGSSHSHTTITDTTYYAYTQNNKDYTVNNIYGMTRSLYIEAVSSYIGRSRVIPLLITDGYDLDDIYNLSFKAYDPLFFYYNFKENKIGRLITLNGSRVPSREYYRFLKEDLLFYNYLYQDIGNLSSPNSYQQIPGYGGGYNTFLYQNKDGTKTVKPTFSQIVLPNSEGQAVWEKIPAGGVPATISDNIINILKKTEYKDIILYSEKCKTSLSVEKANLLKNFNVIIKNKKIPLEGAGCKITYLCEKLNSKDLEADSNSNQTILDGVYS